MTLAVLSFSAAAIKSARAAWQADECRGRGGSAERERSDLMVRSIGGKPHALAKLLDGDDSVGSHHFGIEVGMVNAHLGDVCLGSLGVRIPEVGLKVLEGGLERFDLSAEALPYRGSCRPRVASVIVQQHKRQVVPVLGLAARKRGCSLGKQETGKALDVHLGHAGDIAVSYVQFANLEVARREPGAAKVHGAEAIARVRRNRRFRGLIVEIGQQLELDDRSTINSVRDPTPDRGGLGREACAAERLFGRAAFTAPRAISRPT